MNWISRNYMRLQFQKRAEALKKAGIPVTQQTVYDERIDVGVPVPTAEGESAGGRRQGDYRVSPFLFFVQLIASSITAFGRFLVTPRGPTVFEETNRQFFRSGGVAKRMVTSLAMVLVGMVLSGWTGTLAFKGVSSASWPTVPGVIQSSEVERNEGTSGRRSTTTRAKLRYAYSVGGQKYIAERICYGDYGSSDGGRAEAMHRRYTTGASVVVHFNPGKPAEAVLETGSTWFLNVWVGLGSFLLFCGLVGVVRTLNARRIYGKSQAL